MNTDQGRCEAIWVVNGEDTPCQNPGRLIILLFNDVKIACEQCAHDLRDFDLYHTEQALAGERAALESWTGKPIS